MNYPGWRRTLRRELCWLLVLKVAALGLLWWLCFSAAHRTPVDGEAQSQRLALTRAPLLALPPAPSSGENRRD